MTEKFGDVLRELRLEAGYGLRKFAAMIGELPSNLSAVETNAREAWRSMDKLEKVAQALSLEEHSQSWDRFFFAARKKGTLPDEVEQLLDRDLNIVLLRTVNELQLSDDELESLVAHVRSEWKQTKENSNARRRSR